MLKLKFLILFIVFIQVVPTFIDIIEKRLLDNSSKKKCYAYDGKFIKIETTAQCIERNSFLPKDDKGSKCCSFIGNPDPLFVLKKTYGENWKKIYAPKKWI